VTPDQLSDAIVSGLVTGGQTWIVQTAAAMLPALWILTLALHLSRPYMLRMLHKFTLRFGADIWWLAYVLLRDAAMLVTFVFGIVCFYPNLVKMDALPLTGSLATALLLVALAVKLTRDADDNATDFRISTVLVLAASALYFIPQVFGVEAADQEYLAGVSAFLTTSSNLDWAIPILYASYAILVATAGYLFSVVTLRGARAPISRRQVLKQAPAAERPALAS
jgi:hypothetical protein